MEVIALERFGVWSVIYNPGEIVVIDETAGAQLIESGKARKVKPPTRSIQWRIYVSKSANGSRQP